MQIQHTGERAPCAHDVHGCDPCVRDRVLRARTCCRRDHCEEEGNQGILRQRYFLRHKQRSSLWIHSHLLSVFVLVAILVFVPVIMSLVMVGLFVVSVVGSALF